MKKQNKKQRDQEGCGKNHDAGDQRLFDRINTGTFERCMQMIQKLSPRNSLEVFLKIAGDKDQNADNRKKEGKKDGAQYKEHGFFAGTRGIIFLLRRGKHPAEKKKKSEQSCRDITGDP